MTFSTTDGTASRTAATSALSEAKSPSATSARSATMSISLAPSATTDAASSAFTLERVAPCGNPTTEQTAMRSPTTPRAKPTMAGWTHTEAHPIWTAATASASTWARVASGRNRV